MRKWFLGIFAAIFMLQLATPVYAALPAGTGMITSCSSVSGSEFSSKSSIAKKLDKMFAGDIGLYKDAAKTKLVDAALGTSNVPNNNVYQYWGPDSRAGTSCFAYANAFYGHFYDGVYPHHSLNSNHKTIKATGKITYKNFVKWGVRDDAAVYIREGNHSVIVLHYDENYITYVDGNGNGKGLIAIRKEAWKRGKGANIYDQKPSLIVQPTTSYFAAGSMNTQSKPCTEGGPSHDWDEGEVTKTASCKETGRKVYTCYDGGKTREDTLSKTSDHSYGDYVVAKEATCDQKGKEVATCATCGKEKSRNISAFGHTYGKTTVVQDGTLWSPGITEKTCKTCGYVKKIKSDCIVRDETFGITLTTKEGVFPKNTTFRVVTPPAPEALEILLQPVTGKSLLLLPETIAKEKPVQPKKAVELELQIPAEFGDNVALYLLENGTLQQLPGTVDPEARVLTVELERFGIFALCDLDAPYVAPEPEPTQPEPTVAYTLPPETEATAVEAKSVTQPAQVNRELLLWLCVATGLTVAFLTLTIILIIRQTKRKKAPIEQ